MLRIYPSIIKTNIISHYKTVLIDNNKNEYDITKKCYDLNITANNIKINNNEIPISISNNLINYLNSSYDQQHNSFYFSKYLVNSNFYSHIAKTSANKLDILKPFDKIKLYSYYTGHRHNDTLEIGEPEHASVYIGKYFNEHLFLSYIKISNKFHTGIFINNIYQLLDIYGCYGDYITFLRALENKLYSYTDKEFNNNIKAYPRKINLD